MMGVVLQIPIILLWQIWIIVSPATLTISHNFPQITPFPPTKSKLAPKNTLSPRILNTIYYLTYKNKHIMYYIVLLCIAIVIHLHYIVLHLHFVYTLRENLLIYYSENILKNSNSSRLIYINSITINIV